MNSNCLLYLLITGIFIQNTTLDIVLPVFNPHLGWEKDIVSCYKALKSACTNKYLTRLILIDDGNKRDLTRGKQYILDKIEESSWFHYKLNKGKGYALREGIKRSTGEVIIYTDFDFPYSIDTMKSMVDKLHIEQCDVVIGVRDEAYYNKIKGPRSWLSKILRKLNSRHFDLITNDTQCGLKVFNQKGAEVFLRTETNRYLVDVEFLKLLSKSTLDQCLYTVKLREGITLSKVSDLRIFRELFNYMKLLFQP